MRGNMATAHCLGKFVPFLRWARLFLILTKRRFSIGFPSLSVFNEELGKAD
jgi:hypothetical protein